MSFSSFRQMLQSSYRELKSVRCLTVAALMAAIYAVSNLPMLGRFIIIPEILEIRFGYLAIAVAAALYGPVVGVIVAFAGDIIGTLMFSGSSFFWGFTLNWVILGFVYGLFFYRHKVSFARVFGAMLFHTLAVNLLLTVKWLSMMTGRPFIEIFLIHIPANAITLPVDIILLLLVLKAVCNAYNRIVAGSR